MATQFNVPGPTRISIGPATGSTLTFLGWATDGVNIILQPRHEDVMSDLSGPAVPQDVQFLGEDAIIRFTLAKYDETVLAGIRSFRYGSTEGTWGGCEIGALMARESKGFRLFLRSPCQSKSGQTAQRGVWNFGVTYPMDAIDFTLSTRVTRPRLTFRAIPEFQSYDGSAVLYDADATGEPTYTF